MKNRLIDNPEDLIKRSLLLMKYDNSKTLNENKLLINEQNSNLATLESINLEASRFAQKIINNNWVTDKDLASATASLSQLSGKCYYDEAKKASIPAIEKFEEYLSKKYPNELKNRKLIDYVNTIIATQPLTVTHKTILMNLIRDLKLHTACPNNSNSSKKILRYKDCGSGPFSKGCYEKPNYYGPIHTIQSCLGIPVDGKFWTVTETALNNAIGRATFTKEEVSNICKSAYAQEITKQENGNTNRQGTEAKTASTPTPK